MKPTPNPKCLLLTAVTALALGAATARAGVVTTTFTIQQGNLLQDGSPYGSGTSYSGVVDGSITDSSATSARTTGATSTIGNQYSASSPNGQTWCGIFSYDLTELNNFITANTGPYSSVAIQSVSFQLVSAGANKASSTIRLFSTDPFTIGAKWNSTDGITAWSSPFQNIGSSVLYGYTGGASALGSNLGGSSPNTGITTGNPLTWTSSAGFITAVNNALARADKTLYLTANVAITTWTGGSDQRLAVNYSPTTTVASRPKLTVTLVVTTTAGPETWTGATDSSWTTAGNWSPSGVPATDAPIIFDTLSTANLSTVLNQDFTVVSVSVTNPAGPVSIGGANSLTVDSGGIDLSAATQDLTISAPVILGVDQTWNVAASRTLTVSGGVSGSASLTIAGAGKVSLGVANVLPTGAGAGNLVVNGTLDLNGTAQAMNGLSGNGTVDNAGGGASILTLGNNNAGVTFNGTLQNTSGTLAVDKVGAGTLTLTGTSTFSGGFTNNGLGVVNSGNPAGTNYCFGTGPVVANTGTLYFTAASWTFTNALTLNGGTLRQGGGNNRLLKWSGPVSVTADSTIQSDGSTAGIAVYGNVNLSPGVTLSSQGNGNTHTIYGSISGSGNLTVNLATLVLSGTNTYTGNTTVSGGTLTLASSGQLEFVIAGNGVNNQVSGTAALNLNGTVNLDMSGADATVGNSWTLVDVANLTENFGANFSVTSTGGAFTEGPSGVWKKEIDSTRKYVFSEATGVLSVQANNAPVAQDIETSVAEGGSVTVPIIGGKYAPADADGDALTITVVGSASSGTAGYTSTAVTYDATGATVGTNTFSYTVSDGFGGTDTRTVSVIVTAVTGSAPNITGLTGSAPGNITVHFAGLPNSIYAVDRTTSLPPSWSEIATTATTGANGLGSYLDTTAPAGTAYYRTRYLGTP